MHNYIISPTLFLSVLILHTFCSTSFAHFGDEESSIALQQQHQVQPSWWWCVVRWKHNITVTIRHKIFATQQEHKNRKRSRVDLVRKYIFFCFVQCLRRTLDALCKLQVCKVNTLLTQITLLKTSHYYYSHQEYIAPFHFRSQKHHVTCGAVHIN